MVLGIQRCLDGREFALGLTLLDTLELGEEDRVARQVHERANVEDLPACAPGKRGGRRDEAEVGQGEDRDADEYRRGKVSEAQKGKRALANDASLEEVDDGQTRPRNSCIFGDGDRVPEGFVSVGVDDDLPGQGCSEFGHDEGACAHVGHPAPVQCSSQAYDTPHETVSRHHTGHPQRQGSAAEYLLSTDEYCEATDGRNGEAPAGDSGVRVQGIGRRGARDDEHIHEGGAPFGQGGEQAWNVRQGLEHVSGSRPRSSPEPS